MLSFMVDNDLEDDAIKEENPEASEIQEKVVFCLESIKEVLKEIEEEKTEDHLHRVGLAESLLSVSSGSLYREMPVQGRKVKLPKLELKKFSGKIAEW